MRLKLEPQGEHFSSFSRVRVHSISFGFQAHGFTFGPSHIFLRFLVGIFLRFLAGGGVLSTFGSRLLAFGIRDSGAFIHLLINLSFGIRDSGHLIRLSIFSRVKVHSISIFGSQLSVFGFRGLGHLIHLCIFSRVRVHSVGCPSRRKHTRTWVKVRFQGLGIGVWGLGFGICSKG